MDQRERYPDPAESMRLAMQYWQSRQWGALPAIVKAFPSVSGLGPMIADVQPTVNGQALTQMGTFSSLQMPVLLDCPVLWMGGGGATLTFPIAKDDECLVIFASRCIDAWWQQGAASGPNPGRDPPDLRMHSLSDGFVLVGVKSLPESFAVDLSNVSLMSDDGNCSIKMNPTAHSIAMIAPGGITMNKVTIDSNGNVVSPAIITGADVKNSVGTSLTTHTTSGVTTGTGTSGKPVVGS
jgi:hypothetical protein